MSCNIARMKGTHLFSEPSGDWGSTLPEKYLEEAEMLCAGRLGEEQSNSQIDPHLFDAMQMECPPSLLNSLRFYAKPHE